MLYASCVFKNPMQKSPCVILYKRQFMQVSIYTIGDKFCLEIDVFSVSFTTPYFLMKFLSQNTQC